MKNGYTRPSRELILVIVLRELHSLGKVLLKLNPQKWYKEKQDHQER